MNIKPGTPSLATELGIGKTMVVIISMVSLVIGVLVLLPPTFFIGCLLNALCIVLIMALALKSGNVKMALIEIPFLLMPLVMIWLGHPLKK